MATITPLANPLIDLPAPGEKPMKRFKIVVEKQSDGYVAYPRGLDGVVVGQGDTADDALADVKYPFPCRNIGAGSP